MILATADFISGYELETIGLVRGSVVKSKNLFVDIFQGFKSIVGGELKGYSKMMEEARFEATRRMIKQAEEYGGDAIVAIRFTTSTILDGASEIMAYGTAVRLKEKEK